jgi:outer membrane protein assembly factor BamD (BamD/ComL family)
VRGRAAAIGAWLALVACGPNRGNAYDRAFAEAARAESAGRFDDAAAGYDAAAKAARRDRDRDQAAYDAAMMVLRAGRWGDAITRLEPIANARPPDEHSAEAWYHIAATRIDHGTPDQGWVALEAMVHRFPSSGLAHRAIVRYLDHLDDADPSKRAGLEWLRRLERELGASEVAELIAYSIATRRADLGETQAARDALVEVAQKWPYPFGALFDDALYRASELDEKLGRYARAIEDLEKMLAERETTTLVGSYERPKYLPAILRIAALYRDRLRDRAKARAAYHRLYTDFTHSTARAEALWHEAALWREDGDSPTACSRLSTLVLDFPDSRYVPCALDACPSLARPKDSHAPKTCHSYLLRRENEGH